MTYPFPQDQSIYNECMSYRDSKGHTPGYYAEFGEHRNDRVVKFMTRYVCSQMEVLSPSQLRRVYLIDYWFAFLATLWVPFVMYAWKFMFFGTGPQLGGSEVRVALWVVTIGAAAFYYKQSLILRHKSYR
jgi:hypothetical protein